MKPPTVRVQIRLTAQDIAKAREIGNGNVSRGIRAALQAINSGGSRKGDTK